MMWKKSIEYLELKEKNPVCLNLCTETWNM